MNEVNLVGMESARGYWAIILGILLVILAITVWRVSIYATPDQYGAENRSNEGSNGTKSLARKQDPVDSFDEKIKRYVANAYSSTDGLNPISDADIVYLGREICSDLESNGDGKFYLPESVSSGDEVTIDLAIALNYAYATNVECSHTNNDEADNFFRRMFFKLAVDGKDATADWIKSELGSQPVTSDEWRSSELYLRDGGSAVLCNDGSISTAEGKQGACSWHGGVSN